MCCCKRPSRNDTDDEAIELPKLPERTSSITAPSGVASQRPPQLVSTLPVLSEGTETRRDDPTASSPDAHMNGSTQNGSIHPLQRADSPTTLSKNDTDPDEISTLAGSAPMYRNVMHAAEDRRELLAKLRRPESVMTLQSPDVKAVEGVMEQSNDAPKVVATDGSLGHERV